MWICSRIPIYIYIANMLANYISLPKHMIVASGTIAPTCIVHGPSDQPGIRSEVGIDSTVQDDIVLLDRNKMTMPTKLGSLRPLQSQNIDKFVNSVHYKPPERREDQMKKHTHLAEQKDQE